MNILFRNTTDFWVPSYVLNDTSYLTWWNLPYFILIFFLIFVCCWLTIHMIIIIWEVRKFHNNANYLISSMYGSWFEGLLGSVLILFYKYGLIDITGSGRIFEGFEDTENFLKIDKITWKMVPLIVGTFCSWHYLGIVNAGFSMFFFERTLATVLLSDYESVPRPKLRIFIIITHHLYALFIAFMMCFHIFPLKKLLGMNAMGLVFLVPHLIFLQKYNIRARNRMRLAQNITKNTLGAKFQTEENLRSITVVIRITVMLMIFDIIFLIICFLATIDAPGTRYYFQAVEHFIFFGPLFLVPAVASSVEDWRKRFLVYIPIQKLRIDPEHNPYAVQESQEETTEIHFLQLQTLWV